MKARYININGKLLPADAPAVPAADRSFRYGYGLFETMLALDGNIRFGEFHWERLTRGLDLLRIDKPVRFIETLQRETHRSIQKNGPAGAVRVRLQVSAGAGGYFDETDWKPFYLIECWPLPGFSADLNENGLVVGIAESRKEPGPFSACKSTSALCYAMAAREAKAAGWNDALLCNAAGHIVESTIANVFVQFGDRVMTPPLPDGCVGGIMRRVLLDRMAAAGMAVAEESITLSMLREADGIILSNALRGVRWVKSIENVRLSADFGNRVQPLLEPRFSLLTP